jgi:hypothetical protein
VARARGPAFKRDGLVPVQARPGSLRARRLPVPSGDGYRRLTLSQFFYRPAPAVRN